MNVYMPSCLIAIKGDHLDIAYDKYNYNGAMSFAAREGHIDIVKLMLKKGANNYNVAMCCAAEYGKASSKALALPRQGLTDPYEQYGIRS